MKHTTCTLCAALLLLTACDNKDATSQKTAEAAKTSTQTGSNKPADKQPSSPPAQKTNQAATSALQTKDVQALLDRWTEAQNSGDFSAYASLYAEPFVGIKRAGDRVTRYERKSWLEDRGKMFKQSMRVETNDVTMRLASQTAVVSFTQRWSSKTFEDVGPKQLVLARQNGSLRIAREEMMSSAISKDDGKFKDPGVAFVFNDMIAVDHHGKPAAGPGQGLQSFDGAAAFNLRREAKVGANLPTSVTTFSKEGTACNATLTTPWRVIQVVPHFSQVQVWNGEMEGQPPLPLKDKEQAAWDMATPFDAAGLKGCPDAKWAFTSAGAKPKVFKPSDASEQERQEATKAVATTNVYKRVQKSFEGYGGQGPFVNAPTIQAYASDGKRFVVISASAQTRVGDECGGYLANMLAVFESTSKGLTFLGAISDGERKVVALLDAKNDNTLEIITEGPLGSELWRASSGKLELMKAFTPIQNFDCSC